MILTLEHVPALLTVFGFVVTAILAYAKGANGLSHLARRYADDKAVLEAEIRRAHSRVTETQKALDDFEKRQAKDLVSREALRDVEKALSDSVKTAIQALAQQMVSTSDQVGAVHRRLDEVLMRLVPDRDRG